MKQYLDELTYTSVIWILLWKFCIIIKKYTIKYILDAMGRRADEFKLLLIYFYIYHFHYHYKLKTYGNRIFLHK